MSSSNGVSSNGSKPVGRGSVAGLPSPVPIGSTLPAVFQEDPFAMRFTAGFDDVLAPVFATLDCLDAYIDPLTAPEDFLDWLAGWVGLILDETWPIDRRRAVIAHSVELYRMRGTMAGLAAHVAIFTGGDVDVVDTGGVAYSAMPGGQLPGEEVPRMAVRVTVDDPTTVDEHTLDALVVAAKPAHVIHGVEVAGR